MVRKLVSITLIPVPVNVFFSPKYFFGIHLFAANLIFHFYSLTLLYTDERNVKFSKSIYDTYLMLKISIYFTLSFSYT